MAAFPKRLPKTSLLLVKLELAAISQLMGLMLKCMCWLETCLVALTNAADIGVCEWFFTSVRLGQASQLGKEPSLMLLTASP
jgi:hypothetical protein